MKPHPPGAVASLVFGILAVIAAGVPVLGMLLGVIAIVQARRAAGALRSLPVDYQAGGLHIAGLVTGIVGTVLSSLATLWGVMLLGLLGALIAASSGPAAPATPPLLW
jgi:hypothetical protein